MKTLKRIGSTIGRMDRSTLLFLMGCVVSGVAYVSGWKLLASIGVALIFLSLAVLAISEGVKDALKGSAVAIIKVNDDKPEP